MLCQLYEKHESMRRQRSERRAEGRGQGGKKRYSKVQTFALLRVPVSKQKREINIATLLSELSPSKACEEIMFSILFCFVAFC